MLGERRRFPVFHEKELEEILEKLDLLEKMKNREIKCSVCNTIISKENFGCIYLSKEGDIKVACSNPECLERVNMEIHNV